MRADFSEAQLEQMITHYVGNKHTDDQFFYAEQPIDIKDEELRVQLKQHFTHPFRDIEEYYEFFHESDINLNAVLHFSKIVFKEPDTLLSNSINAAKHLYEISDSPNIKSGEFHVVYLTDVYIDGGSTDAIGIFKTENRDQFFKFEKSFSGYEINIQEGIQMEKIDKGCIIYNIGEELTVSVIDKINKKNDTIYWIDKFLKIKAKSDEYHHTSEYLTATKDFITKQIPEEYEVTKAQQVDLLNRSIKFFKENNEFNEQAFAHDVFEDPELIKSFNGYKRNYEEQHETELGNSFFISGTAVKKSARVFKSVIKLDKNFHVYVHGDRDLVEKGYDEAVGKHYYKIYFDQET